MGHVCSGELREHLRGILKSNSLAVEQTGAREVELERELATVKEENATLRADSEDLNNLLMEYAATLEKVLDGLRVYAVGLPLSSSLDQ